MGLVDTVVHTTANLNRTRQTVWEIVVRYRTIYRLVMSAAIRKKIHSVLLAGSASLFAERSTDPSNERRGFSLSVSLSFSPCVRPLIVEASFPFARQGTVLVEAPYRCWKNCPHPGYRCLS